MCTYRVSCEEGGPWKENHFFAIIFFSIKKKKMVVMVVEPVWNSGLGLYTHMYLVGIVVTIYFSTII